MLDLQPSSFETFEREAGQGNVVPVVRSVLGDLHTPVGTFMRIAGNSRYAFLLESVEGGERIARYSFLGADPEMVVRGQGLQTYVEKNGRTESFPIVATEWVRDYFRGRSLARCDIRPVVGCRSIEPARTACLQDAAAPPHHRPRVRAMDVRHRVRGPRGLDPSRARSG